MSHKHPSSKDPSATPKKEQAESQDTPHVVSLDIETPAAASEETEKLRAELEQAKDRTLRTQAELENYRKRASRELEDRLRYANLDMMRDLLPVLDNIQRAVEAAEKSPEINSLLEGVKMVGSQLETVLDRYHCKKIEALSAPFDPNLHHAISQMPSADEPANTVMVVAQEGYQLHDRVVRPSQVIVSTAVPKGE